LCVAVWNRQQWFDWGSKINAMIVTDAVNWESLENYPKISLSVGSYSFKIQTRYLLKFYH
jgi:hypothetical protein